MAIQCFLNFGDICHFSFRELGHYGIFFKIIKGIQDTGSPPSRASVLEIIENLPIMLDILLKVCIKMKLMEILLAHTVNLELFAKILFLPIALKDIVVPLKFATSRA